MSNTLPEVQSLLLLEDNRYYTYIYLDPRKPGKYQYSEYRFNYEPFYVGKGYDNRLYDHVNEVKGFIDKGMTNKEIFNLKENRNKRFKIKKILESDQKPIIIKILKNISEQEAKDLEIKLIDIIGRKDKGLGH